MKEFEFLKYFETRMQAVSHYSILCENSFRKDTWQKYGIESHDMQMNLLFMLLLLIMEYSLREENNCTLTEMSDFVGDITNQYFEINLTGKESLGLTKFMINDIFMNDGRPMIFRAIDTDNGKWQDIRISFIRHDIREEDGTKITYYFLTDECYKMLFSTKEMEDNMRLEISELIFKRHLERADYSRAVEDIKSYFQQIRKEIINTETSIIQIKRNALNYSSEDYKKQIDQNQNIIHSTRAKFIGHREFVTSKIKEFEEKNVTIEHLSEKEQLNLRNLRTIDRWLQKSLAEHQRIFGVNFDLKKIYGEELERAALRDEVNTFPIRKELYDKVLENPAFLLNIDKILSPLFFGSVNKIFNLEKMLECQKKQIQEKDDSSVIMLEFNTEEYKKEQEEKRKKKQKMYEDMVRVFLKFLVKYKEYDLSMLNKECAGIDRKHLTPNLEIFKDVLIAFLSAEESDIEALKKEQKKSLVEQSDSFSLNETILELVKEKEFQNIKKISTLPAIDKNEKVIFEKIKCDETGRLTNLRCPNIIFKCEEK